MQEYFQTMARYHVWATDRILGHVAQMTENDYRADAGLFFKSVHGTLNHLLVAERHWHSRFADGVSLKLALDAELETKRDALADALRTGTQRWRDWLSDVPQELFANDLKYTRNSGEHMVTPYAATLGHVFNHGTHHRGQISAALTGFSYASPELDIIYMLQSEMHK